MIFVSTSGIQSDKIRDSVEILARAGFQNIELSGGSGYYESYVKDLLFLKDKYNLNLRCHNYFPPPKDHFVLNLSSPNSLVVENSIEYIKSSIDLSKKLNSNKYAFHAGFLMEVHVSELGKKIQKRSTVDRREAIDSFTKIVNSLFEYSPTFELYVENNVLSKTNYESYENNNPFLMVETSEILSMLKAMNAKLLLDVAHLKVSCNTLNLDFSKDLSTLLSVTDYIHLSDNDGLSDSNESLVNGDILTALEKNKSLLRNKDFTLEIYSGIKDIQQSYTALKKVLE